MKKKQSRIHRPTNATMETDVKRRKRNGNLIFSILF